MNYSGKIKKHDDVPAVMDGEEICRQYFQTDKITFGMSELGPWKVGGLDTGHAEADEVFFCVQGHVLCYFPEDDHYYELWKGDALLIPPNTGHKLFNISDETAIITWSCAPKP